MTLDVVVIQPLVALIAGILILLMPRILNYVVAIYLIFIGLVGLWPRLRVRSGSARSVLRSRRHRSAIRILPHIWRNSRACRSVGAII